MKSELVLVFHRDKKNYPKALDQLAHDFDAASTPGRNEGTPSLIIATKPDWVELEMELAEKIKSKYDPEKIRGYDRVTATTPKGQVELPIKGGFNAIIYRSRPIVAMDAGGDNIISARLGGLSE